MSVALPALFLSPDAKESVAVASIPRDAIVTAPKLAVTERIKLTAVPVIEVIEEELAPAIARVESSALDVNEAAPPQAATDPVAAPAEDLTQLLRSELRAPSEPALPQLGVAYRSLRRLAALVDLPRLQEDGVSVVGIASTYNPYRDGPLEGGPQTASGEIYDVESWTAAIQIGLRGQFGGVRYGRNYRPAYALVESGGKQAIVKINDVGPLKPGRIIDLNERSMRYFDPFLHRGLLHDVRVTLLPGEDWTPGPVGGAAVVRYAGNISDQSVSIGTSLAE